MKDQRRSWVRGAGWVVGVGVATLLAGDAQLGAQPSATASTLEVFRIFLKDGKVLNSYGECATLPAELVCMVKLGGGSMPESHDVLTLPLKIVDEPRTREYARSLRAAQYGATRGERDYAELTADLMRVMAEVETSTNREQRLAMAQMARQRLANWSADHFDYKAADTRQLLAMLDEVIAELRIAAGDTKFSFDIAANIAPSEAAPLLPAPGLQESLEAALSAAQITPVAAERMSLLRSANRVAATTSGIDPALRTRIARTLRTEEVVEGQYRALMRKASAAADVAVRHGRVSQVQRLIWNVNEENQKLGARRPREMAAFIRRLEIELQLAKDQQRAFARWEAVKGQLYAYELRLRPLLDGWMTQRLVLRDIRAERVVRATTLDAAVRRFTALNGTLSAMRPLPEVREVHALLRSAVQMARQAMVMRRRAATTPDADVSRNASAAVAGAELLLTQARTQLVRALHPRKVR